MFQTIDMRVLPMHRLAQAGWPVSRLDHSKDRNRDRPLNLYAVRMRFRKGVLKIEFLQSDSCNLITPGFILATNCCSY